MKNYRTLNGLLKSIAKDGSGVMKVWGVSPYGDNGAYLNLGESRYIGVGKTNWNKIKNNIRKPNGDIPKTEYWSY